MPTKAAYIRLHLDYLKKHQPRLLKELQTQGKLQQHLQDTGQEAMRMFNLVSEQMAANPSLPKDYGQRVQALENIPHAAEELVLHDVVYQPI